MIARYFKGGVHPPERKLAAGKKVETLPPPQELIVPLSMHLGAPAKPVVQGGERVLRGQVIGEAGGFVSAVVHSPVSGTVRKIEPREHPIGRPLPCVIIDNDGQDETVAFAPVADWTKAEPAALLEAVQRAGIVGLGGAAFPTHVKLKPPANFPIDTLIANGVECEPYLTPDHRLMLEEPARVLEGLQIARRILGVQRAYLGIEANKPDAIEVMRRQAPPEIEVVPLRVRYPQGAEKQLIYTITGRQVPSGGLPMNVGCVVQNVATLAAIRDAVVEGKPLMERIVNVTGEAIREPKNLLARFGTPIRKLIEAAGGLADDAAKVINGGPMMGTGLWTLDVPLLKNTNGILCLPQALVQTVEPHNCLRCGACVRACPSNLLPTDLFKAVRAGMFDMAEKLGALDCIECGSCSYGCPSRIPLVQWIRLGKAEVMARKKK